MLDNIKGVLFDLDGTLFDSMSVWVDIDKEFLDENGFVIDYEALKKDIGGCSMLETADYFIARFNMKETREELVEQWNSMAKEHYANSVPAKAGAIELLSELKRRGIKTAVASSNSRVLIETALISHGMEKYIDAIVTSDEVKKGKPEPDVYLAAARAIGVSASDCLVFEDIEQGIRAGQRAGAKTCVIYDKYSEYDWQEKKKLADYYINDFYEVLEG